MWQLLLKYWKIHNLKKFWDSLSFYQLCPHSVKKKIFFLIHPVTFKSIFCLISAILSSWAHHQHCGLICFKYVNKKKCDCCGEKPRVLPDPLSQEINESCLFSLLREQRCALLFQERNVFNVSVTKLKQKSF